MILLRSIFIIALLSALYACSDPTRDTAGQYSSTTAHQSDQSADITISPTHATARTVLSLRTGASAINTGETSWYINGYKVPSSDRFQFSSDELKKGDTVQAAIVSGSREYRSNELTIKNTPPAIRDAQLLPALPVVSDVIRPAVTADDADRDKIYFKYHWTLNGKFAGEESYLETELKRDDIIMVEVTPYDGEEYGRSIKLKGMVTNSLPTVTDSTPSLEENIYQYRVEASDPDRDPLTYKIEQGPDGMVIDPSTGVITWQISDDSKGVHEVTVSVNDGNGGMIYVPISVMIDTAYEKQ